MTSCIRYGQLRYMHKDGERSSVESKADTVGVYRLQPEDLINIDITSTVDGGNTELLNRTITSASTQSTDEAVYTRGYMIDADGYIELPFVGKIKISGLTSVEAEKVVLSKLSEYLNHITIRLRLMSYRVTYLGEFNRVGNIVMYSPKVTILQAIAMGGDLTDYANRKHMVIYRTGEDGKIKRIEFDLTRKDIFNKSYYIMKPNDVMYAEPVRVKVLRSNSQSITLALSLITFVLLLNTYIKR